jgi:hypothetical protein
MAAILQLVKGWDRIATTNLVTNPSFESGTTGWVPSGTNTIALSNSQSKFGANSLLCTYQDSTTFATYNITLTAAAYTFSAWVYIPSDWDGGQIQLGIFAFTSATTDVATTTTTATDTWTRLQMSFTPDASDVAGALLLSTSSAPTAGKTIHVDGVQCELKDSYSTTYADGDQPGCVWNGTPHASTSTRTASSRTKIRLLDNKTFHLKEVGPLVPEYRGGGTYRSSPFADGRRLVDTKYDNVVETYTLTAWATDHDRMADITQDIRQLLADAANYWTQAWAAEPVWLEARSAKETNSRYALVMNGQIPEDNNHWAQPFMHHSGGSVMNDWDMVIERGFWLSDEPTEGTAILLSSVEPYGEETVEVARPGADADDGYVNNVTWVSSDPDRLGNSGGLLLQPAIRFPSVNVPQGATINSAIITFMPSHSDSAATVNIDIAAENADDPAQIVDTADFNGRSRATAVDWSPGAWTAATAENTPDIAASIQDVVNRAGWAAGQAMNIFFDDDISSSGALRRYETHDTASGDEPFLTIEYTSTEKNYGNVTSAGVREATTRNEVYVANKRNMANITHVYHYDDSATTNKFSDNLIGETPPYALLPATPAANDVVYFGISTSIPDSGPFCSLIFDVGTPAIYTGAATLDWKYWSGAAWSSFSAETDRTADTKPFDKAGVNGLFFLTPAAWAANEINGVTAYWVRAEVNLGGGTISTVPTQQNRDIYSVVWPYIEVQDTDLLGDAEAAIRLIGLAQAGLTGGLSKGATGRLIAGSRSVSRGENFTPVINLSQEQNPSDVTVAVTTAASFAANVEGAATGEAISLTSNGTHQERFKITIAAPLAAEYRGKFHAFLRTDTSTAAGPGNATISLHYKLGSGGNVIVGESGQFAYYGGGPLPGVIVDLGIVDFRGSEQRLDEIEIAVHADALVAWEANDLWLIPADEWSFDVRDKAESSGGYIIDDKTGRIDGISSPRRDTYGLFEYADMQAEYQAVVSGAPRLAPNKRIRVYFLHAHLPDNQGNSVSVKEACLSMTLQASKRYFSLRGAA